MQGKQGSGAVDARSDNLWWATLAGRVLPSVELQIIEALRVIGRPVTPGELFLVFDQKPLWLSFARYVRHLTDLGVIEIAEIPPDRNPFEITYQLAPE